MPPELVPNPLSEPSREGSFQVKRSVSAFPTAGSAGNDVPSEFREPSFTVRMKTDQPRSILFFEPVGSEYELSAEDEVLVHVYERSNRPEDADVEVMHAPGIIQLWLPATYRAWNKAGAELHV